jgi:hypothetical protein
MKKIIFTNVICVLGVTIYVLFLLNYGLRFIHDFSMNLGISLNANLLQSFFAFILGFAGFFLFKGKVFLRYVLITISQILAHTLLIWSFSPSSEPEAKAYIIMSIFINFIVVGFGIVTALLIVDAYARKKSTPISK